MLTGELDTIDAAVTAFAARPDWSRDDTALVAACVAVHTLQQRLAGLAVRLVGEIDARGLARELGATSTTAWVRWRLHQSAAGANSTVRLARELRDRSTTAAAVADGRLTTEQAHVIVTYARTIQDALQHTDTDSGSGSATVGSGITDRRGASAGTDRSDGPENIVDRVEELLIEQAAHLDPVHLRVAARHALATIAPDAADDLERRALDAAERRSRQRRHLDLQDDDRGGAHLRGYLDAEGAIILRTALGPLCDLRGMGDERTATQRRADALVELCDRVMREGTLPAQGGQPTQLVITTRLETIRDGLGVAGDDSGAPLSANTVRRMACDAAILPAVLNGGGQVLDVGRTRRLFTGPLRRALAIRDRGCAFPGCDRPVRWTDGHHIISWLNGGTTDVDNGVLVCRVHHGLVHDANGWQVRLGTDKLPEFIPPPWIDPDQRPLRNTRHAARSP